NTTVPSEIAIYPNPAYDLLFVDSNEPTETIISDMNGKLILKSTAHKIDLQEISSGVYELIAIHSKGLIRTRLVIQR
ncbi:MAG: T9SS type A sorting domain-containing protein, partial [Bacteroidota bacterium]